MLANLLAQNVKIVPYKLAVKGLDWNVETNGSKLDIVGHGWQYHNNGKNTVDRQTIWKTAPATATSEAYTVNRIGEILNVTGDGWSVHTDQNVLDVHEGIGYDIGAAHAMAASMPGFVAQFVPAGQYLPTKTQTIPSARTTPLKYNPFSANCQ